jgi:hypothetical protein
MLIQSAVIIVGVFLLAALIGAGVCLYRNRALFKTAARKTSDAFKHGTAVLKAAIHHPPGGTGAAVAPTPAEDAPPSTATVPT